MLEHIYQERTLKCKKCIGMQREMIIKELVDISDETDEITPVLVLHYINGCNDNKMMFEVITNPMSELTDDEYKELEPKMFNIEKDIDSMLEKDPYMKKVSEEDLVVFNKKYSVHVGAIGFTHPNGGDDNDDNIEFTEKEMKMKINSMLNLFGALPKETIIDRLRESNLTPNEMKYAEKYIDEFYENNEGTGIFGDIIEKKEGESFRDAIFRGIENSPISSDAKKNIKDSLGVKNTSATNMNDSSKPKFYS